MVSDSFLHTANPHTPPLSPSGPPQTHRNTKFFAYSPVGQSVRKFIFNPQVSSSPYSQCPANYGLAGLGPKLAGFYLPPFSYTPFLSPLIIREQRHTHLLFATGWCFIHQHPRTLFGLHTCDHSGKIWSLPEQPALLHFFGRDNSYFKISDPWYELLEVGERLSWSVSGLFSFFLLPCL